jgi:transcriptional regulator with XRE-family HTH domain
MKIEKQLTDETVLSEIGSRLARQRVDLRLTQAKAAEQAGIAKRTLERLEAGGSTETLSMIRVLRALSLMEGLNGLVPESLPRPMDLLKLKGKERKRVSSPRKVPSPKKWRWGDEK